MPSFFARWCLALTAVSPAMGAAAIIAVTIHGSWAWGLAFMMAGVLTVALTWLVLNFLRDRVAQESLEIQEVEQADPKVLEFLLAYLLPVFSGTKPQDVTGSVALTIYSLLIVSLVVVNGNIFQFNPVLACFGYHFYVVTSTSKIKYLIITKNNYHKSVRKLNVKKLSEYFYLETER